MTIQTTKKSDFDSLHNSMD